MIRRWSSSTRLPTVEGIVQRIRGNRLVGLAAEITFYEVLAFFPFLILCLTVIRLLPVDGLILTGLSLLSALGPPHAVKMLGGWIEQAQSSSQVSLISFGALIALWVGSYGIASFQRAFSIINARERPQPLWFRIVVRLVLTAGGALALVVLLLFWVVWPMALRAMSRIGWQDFSVEAPTLGVWMGRGIGVAILVTGMVGLYGVLTPRRGSWRSHVPGAVLATGLFLVFSSALSLYFRMFGTFQTIYGSLASMMVLMVWLQTINISVLLGEEWNLERTLRRERLGRSPAP